MRTKRIINIRISAVLFVGLMLGILFCRAYIMNYISKGMSIVIIISLLLFSAGVMIYAFLTQKRNESIRAFKYVSLILKISSIGLVLSFLVGIIISMFPLFKFYTVSDFSGEVLVYGTVCDYVEDNETYTKFLIDNVKIIDTDKTIDSDIKVCVYTSKSADITLGSKVEFEGELDKYKITNSIDANKIYQNIYYSCYVDYSDIDVVKGNSSVKDKIKSATKDILDANLNSDNSNIFYAVLFGEKSGLSDDIEDMFSMSGISHILAVSGLHIGVLVSCIYFIFKKIKINEYARFTLLSIILIFYSYLCSFTPSVCRACIMAIILDFTRLLKVQYDSFMSLSVAGIIILLFAPMSLFYASFQLSFLCIFAIIAIAPSLESFLKKIKLPKFLSTSLAISIATNIAILPICFNVFTKVSLLGILANIFVLPIFSITYVLLFVILIISLILKFMGFLLFIPNLFLQVIKIIANLISSIPFGIFRVFNVSYWSLVVLILSALSIHFLMIKISLKSIVSSMLAVIVFVIFVVYNIPKSYVGNNFIFISKTNSNACYYIEDNKTTLVGSNITYKSVLNDLKRLKINNLKNIVAYDLSLNKIEELIKIRDEYKVEEIYLPDKFEYEEIENKLKNVKYFKNNLDISNLNLSTIEYNEEIIAIIIKSTWIGKILIPEISPNKAESLYISENAKNTDIVYLNSECKYLDFDKINPYVTIVNKDKIYYQDGKIADFDIFVYN